MSSIVFPKGTDFSCECCDSCAKLGCVENWGV